MEEPTNGQPPWDAKRVFKTALTYIFTFVFGTMWVVKQIPFIWSDPRGYLARINREMPAVLKKSDLGRHGYLQLKNGTRIHYVEDGDREKPLMLFLHGFPEFWYSWRHQMRHFRQEYHVVAIDLRGYGDSSKPHDISSYTVDKLVDDVRLVVKELGYDSCVLVGHDWGGIVSWAFCNRYPEMIQKFIVMNAPHPGVFKEFMKKNFKQVLKSWYMFAFQLPYIPELVLSAMDFKFIEDAFTKPPLGAKPGTLTPEDLDAFKYNFSAPGALTGPVNYYRANLNNPSSERTFWNQLPFPILCIFGTEDGAISQETAILSKKYAGGDFEMQYLDGISHWVNQEAPKEVNKAMEAFLRRYQ